MSILGCERTLQVIDFILGCSGYYTKCYDADRPQLISVEPNEAACLLESSATDNGKLITSQGSLKTIMAGHEVPLCGSCEAFGAALGKGAIKEQIELKNGSVMLLTSSDEAVLADLHKWIDRNDEEMKKMMADMAEEEK